VIVSSPEAVARLSIDAALEAAGWVLQDVSAINLYAGRGIAVREFPLKSSYGFADYLLFVDGEAVGEVEAKKEGETLTGVEGVRFRYWVSPRGGDGWCSG
jgi:type I restriction enzyme R subunit